MYSCFLRSAGVNTDSRTLKAGQMFWALKGPSFNGNNFARKALEMGAAFVVVDEDVLPGDKRVLKVSNGLEYLQKLAHYHRLNWGKKIIAICGSNGKTTTKELIYRVLSTEMSVYATPGNFNNHIGVPLCLLQLTDEHDIAVIEMGANHRHEIENLCYLSEPDSGLITNIGKDHLEGFGSIDTCARSNGELFDFLKNHLGFAFINTLDEWNLKLQARISSIYTFPAPNDDAPCLYVGGQFFINIQVPGHDLVETRLTGAYNFNNIACALAVGKYYGINTTKALQAVASYVPSNNRSQIIKTAKNTVISDAYNANPSSMLAALENLRDLPGKSKTAILGDMLELGKDSKKEHELLGRWASENTEIQFLVVGPEMMALASSCPECHYFEKKEQLEKFIQEAEIENSIILLKGSRGMKLETILPLL